MNRSPVLWLIEQEVVDLVSLEDAIEALEAGLVQEDGGGAKNVAKALSTWGDGNSMHSLGSIFVSKGYAGFKTWVKTKPGGAAIFALFNSNSGSLVAMIEAGALGQMRTAGVSGLATRWLSKIDAQDMALIGTGAQSLTQIAATAAVRPINRLRVFSPTPERRRAFIDKARTLFQFPIDESASVQEAVEGAEIVTCITRSSEPFLKAEFLSSGCHVNAVGAILPANAELEQDVFDRANLVVVDYLPNVKAASREFIERFQNGPGNWDDIKSLGKVIAEGRQRAPGVDVSLFKALGMGLSDLSIAVMVYERACQAGIGKSLPPPVRAKPRWGASREGNLVGVDA
ncbi:ornithine cyclodeaminase [Polaromonas sp. OV174]|uniref:ornithine cyclodeaminase family protein n=1 Tax=Polaromonas sp. OV174 TaxID=1855300 RepID=UPI0008F2A648|nr:ornithine cyclodeaminase family protein [Polaromonas sp. OV174]SFB89985.1 ornithine cyclodeaminase [Polaromonas sp. OV174]